MTSGLGSPRPPLITRNVIAAARAASGSIEAMSRIGGSNRFLVAQSVAVAVWVAINIVLQRIYVNAHPHCLLLVNGVARYSPAPQCAGGVRPPDPYPFTFLLLVVSVQAAFAAPLVLIGQNLEVARARQTKRSDDIDKDQIRDTTAYLIAQTTAVRLRLDSALTRDEVRQLLSGLEEVAASPEKRQADSLGTRT